MIVFDKTPLKYVECLCKCLFDDFRPVVIGGRTSTILKKMARTSFHMAFALDSAQIWNRPVILSPAIKVQVSKTNTVTLSKLLGSFTEHHLKDILTFFCLCRSSKEVWWRLRVMPSWDSEPIHRGIDSFPHFQNSHCLIPVGFNDTLCL